MLKDHNKQKNMKKGFTLVELLVTISMFVIITGVVLVNSKKFDSTVLLHNFAYDVALTIKQAQTYAVNVRETSNLGVSSDNLFKYDYGVYFDVDQNGGTTNFVLFNDVVGAGGLGGPDRIYDSGISTCSTVDPECIQRYSMQKGTSIQYLCAGTGDLDCNSNTKKLAILFKRPNLSAYIYADNSAVQSDYAKIVLSSLDGATSTVVVTSAGQIYIK